MKKILFKNCTLLENDLFSKADLYVTNGIFTYAFGDPDEIIDINGGMVLPGLIDIHTHGAVGIDFNRIKAGEFGKITQFYLSQGVTSFLPTILSDSQETTLRQAALISAQKSDYPQIKGIHLEGPYLSHTYKGAMPEKFLKAPDYDEIAKVQEAANGNIRLMTIAPEFPEAASFIKKMIGLGITVSLGHSNATYAETMIAIEAGARGATHTFNAMRLFHQHEPAIMGAVLMSDKVFCEAICDYRHLVKDSFNFLFNVKGIEKVILVTDSIMAAGLGNGDYWLGVNEVTVANGDALIKGTNVRAGSVLTGIQAVKNAADCTHCSILKAGRMMTENPSGYLAMGHIGNFNIGSDADFLILDKDIIKAVYFGGEIARD
jgi:N-acetylglucosamine-6-phosphate deacetylase